MGLIIASATFIVYIPTLNGEFLWYDDDIMIFNNPLIMKFNFYTVKNCFGFDNIIHYHPLVYISYSIEYSLFGAEPFIFRLDNVLLHCVNSLLVFLFIKGICSSLRIAFITALIFAVHPLHTESVAWATERKDVLYSFFYLFSLIMYVKFSKSGKTEFYYSSVLLFICSCFSKAMAVTLPAAILLIDYILPKSKLTLKNKIPYIFISIIFVIINLKVAHYKTDMPDFSFYERVALVFYSVLFYPYKMLLPIKLSAIYPYPESLEVIHLVSVMMAPGLVYAFIKLKTPAYVKFGISFYLITVFPVLPLIPFGISVTAERFVYLPMLGLIYAVVKFIYSFSYERMTNNNLFSRIAFLIIGVVIITLSYIAFQRAAIWKNTETLMNNVLENDSRNYFACLILGNYYFDKNLYEKAAACYQRSVVLKPGYADAYFNLGNAYFKCGKYNDALKAFYRVTEIKPGDMASYNNIALIYETIGEYSKAMEYYKKAAELGYEPALNVLRYYNLAN